MLDRVVNTMINAKLPEPDRVGQRLELHIQAEPLLYFLPIPKFSNETCDGAR